MLDPAAHPLRAVLFDKDGTLVDFHATWDSATGAGLDQATDSSVARRAAADAIGYDLEARRIRPNSVFIAGSNDEIMAALEGHIDVGAFTEACIRAAAESTAPADGLPELLHRLRARGLGLGVATNDWAEIATEQLEILGWVELFDVVLGSDSGFGAKPEPDMLLEAARQLGAEPAQTLMVGDTAHDLHAGRSAGMQTVLVTGSGSTAATGPEVVALADIVVASLGELEDVLVRNARLAASA